MNGKWLIGIVILVVLVGGIYFLNKNITSTTTPSQTTTESAPVPTSGSQPTSPATSTNQQNTVTLTQDGFSPTQDGFSPATLTIKTGTTVTWINKSGTVATVNSVPHPIHTTYSPLNLGSFPDGGTLSLSFDKPGTYGYHNHLNASQKGTIVVQ